MRENNKIDNIKEYNKIDNIEEYKNWLKDIHKIHITSSTERYFDNTSNGIKSNFEKSNFWYILNNNLREYESDYRIKKGFPLLIGDYTPILLLKPFKSYLLKTYRRNYLENKNWPDEPVGGWILPTDWSKVNDILRTLIIVKYLDGVEFIIDKIDLLAKSHDYITDISYEARDEGYYAAHIIITKKIDIPKINWDSEMTSFSIEIQITTQLQEVIRSLTHKFYEERRTKLRNDDLKWQWNYDNDEFAANYLGHILHYIEGMIMEVRGKQKGEEKK